MDQFNYFIENINNPRLLKNYLKVNAGNLKFNTQDDLGNTLLHYAASVEDLEVTKILIDFGCNPNIVNHNFELPLKLYIVNHNYRAALEILKSPFIDMNALGENDNTIMHDAVVYNCDISFIKKLHKLGCELDIVDESNATPLHIAVECGNLPVAEFILSESRNKTIKNDDGKTPLDIAIEMNNKKMQGLFAKYR